MERPAYSPEAGPVPVVLLGGENNALSVARCLSSGGIPVFALNRRGVASTFSRRLRLVDAGGLNGPDDWLKFLTSSAADRFHGAVIMCCSDESIKFVAENHGILSKRYILQASPPEVRLRFLDKLSTYETAQACDIPYPKFWRIGDGSDLTTVAAECEYPVILKPRISQQWKYLRADNELELMQKGAHCAEQGIPIIVMEYIPGGDELCASYYTYIDERGMPLCHFTKRNLRRHPVNSGGTTYHMTEWIPEVAELGLKLFKAAGLRGLGNVEFKRDPRDGRLKLIEVNARYTAGNALVAYAGINLAMLEYAQLLGKTYSAPQTFPAGLTMWEPVDDFLAFRGLNRAGMLTWKDWLGQARTANITPSYSWSDPLPALRTILLSAEAGMKPHLGKLLARGKTDEALAPAPKAMAPGQLSGRIIGARGPANAVQQAAIVLAAIGHRVDRFRSGRISSGQRHMWAQRVQFYQSMWRKAAAETGASIDIDDGGAITMRKNGRCLKARDNETYVDSEAPIHRAGDKILVHNLLRANEIAVPQHVLVGIGEFSRALEFMAAAGGAVVVKPASQTGGGSGVTTNVTTASRLRSAMGLARTFCREILLEQQIAGDSYRVLFMDGRLVDSIIRFSPSVTGDGKSTIAGLLRSENAERVRAGIKRSQVLIGDDDDLRNTVAMQGLGMGSVLEPGRRVTLKQAINQNALQENAPATQLLCPAIIEEARKASELAGLRLAGVDVMTCDASRPLNQTGGAIIEVNAPPNLYYHHLDGRKDSVATSILRAFFDDFGAPAL